MKHNFDQPADRRGSNSYKWDTPAPESTLPLWVADMDFATAPVVVEALKRRVEHGIFGYTRVPESYYRSVMEWFARRHGWSMEREWLMYTSGVVPALSAVIKALTQPGDQVIVQTPVYNCFFSSIANNGCRAVANPLIYERGTYRMDYDDLERKAAAPEAKLLLLCNPHNPAGRVWRREELERLGEICLRHGVTVVSDEIHGEFAFNGHRYTPFAAIGSDCLHHSVTCTSPSKAFNTAGLQIANIVCHTPLWRERIDRAININEVCDVNPFGVEALQAAYTAEGAEWLDQLNRYLWDNYLMLRSFFRQELPLFGVTELEGTYLAWIDCGCLGMDSARIAASLLERQRVWVNEGTMYDPAGSRFIRINMACPRARLADGLERIKRGLDTLMEERGL